MYRTSSRYEKCSLFYDCEFFHHRKIHNKICWLSKGRISCELISTKELAFCWTERHSTQPSTVCTFKMEKDVLIDDDYCRGQRCENFSHFDLRQSLICVKWWTESFFYLDKIFMVRRMVYSCQRWLSSNIVSLLLLWRLAQETSQLKNIENPLVPV